MRLLVKAEGVLEAVAYAEVHGLKHIHYVDCFSEFPHQHLLDVEDNYEAAAEWFSLNQRVPFPFGTLLFYR